jgi:hypothetical protein
MGSAATVEVPAGIVLLPTINEKGDIHVIVIT